VTVLGGNCVGSNSSRLVHFVVLRSSLLCIHGVFLFVLSRPAHLKLMVMRVVVDVSNIR